MASGISTLGLQLLNIANLTAGQSYISKLSQQLSTGKLSTNLSDYNASDAQQLMDFTNLITAREGYISVTHALNPRLQTYDTSLTNIEKTVAEMSSALLSNPTYNPGQNGSLASQIQSAMRQMNYYLNQKVGERYIFAGSRYTTAPVGDITALSAPAASDAAAIATNVSSHTLPAYDSEAYEAASVDVASGSMTLAARLSGTFGNGISMTLAAGTTSGTKATISVAGQYQEVYDNIAGTGATFWTNLTNAINSRPSSYVTATDGTAGGAIALGSTYTLAGGTGSSVNFTASASVGTNITFTALNTGTSGNSISVSFAAGTTSGTKATITDGTTTEIYDNIAGSGATLWTNIANAVNAAPSDLVLATVGGGADVPSYTETYALVGGSDQGTAAYAQDQVAIDTTTTLRYGISSNEEAFQQIILGLRFAYQATQDTANYQTHMATAKNLLNNGLSALRGIHTALASNNATLEQVQTQHQTLISNLKSQIGDVQNVDVNEVAVKLNAFQAQLQASYAATARMTSLSILQYLQ